MRISDWSSDVCSSDLRGFPVHGTGVPIFSQPRTPALRNRANRCEGDGVSGGFVGVPRPPVKHRATLFGKCRTRRGARRVRFSGGFRGGGADGVKHRATLFAECRTAPRRAADGRSEEHTSELQSLMRNSYAVFCLTK